MIYVAYIYKVVVICEVESVVVRLVTRPLHLHDDLPGRVPLPAGNSRRWSFQEAEAGVAHVWPEPEPEPGEPLRSLAFIGNGRRSVPLPVVGDNKQRSVVRASVHCACHASSLQTSLMRHERLRPSSTRLPL